MRKLAILLASAALIGVCVLTIRSAAPRIERDVESRARIALTNAGLGWASPSASGRDLRIGGVAPSEAARHDAEQLVRGLRGVRLVTSNASLARLAPVGARPPAPSPFDAEPQEPDSQAAGCAAELGRLLASTRISFLPGRYSLREPQREQLNALASALRRCPGARVEIAAYADASGSVEMNRRLSLDRASSVASFLAQLGISEQRFDVAARGESDPRESNDTEAGRESNRRIEFKLQGS